MNSESATPDDSQSTFEQIIQEDDADIAEAIRRVRAIATRHTRDASGALLGIFVETVRNMELIERYVRSVTSAKLQARC